MPGASPPRAVGAQLAISEFGHMLMARARQRIPRHEHGARTIADPVRERDAKLVVIPKAFKAREMGQWR